jgi:hypothetical protein
VQIIAPAGLSVLSCQFSVVGFEFLVRKELKSLASARGLCSGFRNKDTKVAASASVVSGSGRELAGVGVNGIAGGNGEIRGELIERKPADFAGLPRFAVLGAASSYAAPIRWGNPMLAFLRQEMVGNAKKTLDGDIDAHFLTSFAKCAFCEVSKYSSLPPTILQQPASGGRLRSVRST